MKSASEAEQSDPDGPSGCQLRAGEATNAAESPGRVSPRRAKGAHRGADSRNGSELLDRESALMATTWRNRSERQQTAPGFRRSSDRTWTEHEFGPFQSSHHAFALGAPAGLDVH